MSVSVGFCLMSNALRIIIPPPGSAMTNGSVRAGCAVWNRPALTDPFVIALPGGGMIILRAFDIKQYPTDTLTASPR